MSRALFLIGRLFLQQPVRAPLLVLCGCLAAFSLFPPPLHAEGNNPAISELRLHMGQDSVMLSAALSAPFGTETRQAMRGGVPFTFRYRIRLTRRGVFLGEAGVRDAVVTHTLRYDPVKQTYLFQGEGYPERVEMSTREVDEAIGWLTTVTDWPLYPLGELKKDVRYRVRVMATLRSVELPSVLGYLFFFTSIFNQDTSWRQVDFSY